MKFCDNCNNALSIKFGSNYDITFHCTKCLSVYQSTAEDTLLYDASKKIGDEAVLQVYTRYAHMDQTITLVPFKCEKCEHEVAKRLLVGQNEQIVYICNNCNNKTIQR